MRFNLYVLYLMFLFLGIGCANRLHHQKENDSQSSNILLKRCRNIAEQDALIYFPEENLKEFVLMGPIWNGNPKNATSQIVVNFVKPLPRDDPEDSRIPVKILWLIYNQELRCIFHKQTVGDANP
jgi:hypothetical protein